MSETSEAKHYVLGSHWFWDKRLQVIVLERTSAIYCSGAYLDMCACFCQVSHKVVKAIRHHFHFELQQSLTLTCVVMDVHEFARYICRDVVFHSCAAAAQRRLLLRGDLLQLELFAFIVWCICLLVDCLGNGYDFSS